MGQLVDEQGNEVTAEDLEIGEYATDSESGEVFYMASPEEAAELGFTAEDEDLARADDEDLVGVGKAGLHGDWGTKDKVAGAAGKFARSRKAQAGAGGAAAGAAAYGLGRRQGASKSLGQTVLEELSKAFDDGDRDQVISKLADRIDASERRAMRAESIAKSLADQAEVRDYTALAAGYELPIDPTELGGILRDVSKVLSEEQLGNLDRILSASGVGFDELGYTGTSDTTVLDQISSLAHDAVSKNAGVTEAEAMVAILEANPAAYDDYCAGN